MQAHTLKHSGTHTHTLTPAQAVSLGPGNHSSHSPAQRCTYHQSVQKSALQSPGTTDELGPAREAFADFLNFIYSLLAVPFECCASFFRCGVSRATLSLWYAGFGHCGDLSCCGARALGVGTSVA